MLESGAELPTAIDRTCNPTAPTNSSPLLDKRILILDGAMGTMIQGYRLDEAGYRGDVPCRPRP